MEERSKSQHKWIYRNSFSQKPSPHFPSNPYVQRRKQISSNENTISHLEYNNSQNKNSFQTKKTLSSFQKTLLDDSFHAFNTRNKGHLVKNLHFISHEFSEANKRIKELEHQLEKTKQGAKDLLKIAPLIKKIQQEIARNAQEILPEHLLEKINQAPTQIGELKRRVLEYLDNPGPYLVIKGEHESHARLIRKETLQEFTKEDRVNLEWGLLAGFAIQTGADITLMPKPLQKVCQDLLDDHGVVRIKIKSISPEWIKHDGGIYEEYTHAIHLVQCMTRRNDEIMFPLLNEGEGKLVAARLSQKEPRLYMTTTRASTIASTKLQANNLSEDWYFYKNENNFSIFINSCPGYQYGEIFQQIKNPEFNLAMSEWTEMKFESIMHGEDTIGIGDNTDWYDQLDYEELHNIDNTMEP